MIRYYIIFSTFLSFSLSPKSFSQALRPIGEIKNLDPEDVAIGKMLYYDKRLSKNKDVSCASCHPIYSGGADGLKLSKGTGGAVTGYNTPSILNAAIVSKCGWEGATLNLKEATRKAIKAPKAMAMEEVDVVAFVSADPTYLAAFNRKYGKPSMDAVLDSLVAFNRYLTPGPSRFDKYLNGDRTALSEQEIHGYQRFKDLGCVSCHQGKGVGGNMFAKFGVMTDLFAEDPTSNKGRYNVTKNEEDMHFYRVPSLRNVALTAPYFHDGRAPDIFTAVRTMGFVQLGRKLSDKDVESIVSFLNSLTGDIKKDLLP